MRSGVGMPWPARMIFTQYLQRRSNGASLMLTLVTAFVVFILVSLAAVSGAPTVDTVYPGIPCPRLLPFVVEFEQFRRQQGRARRQPRAERHGQRVAICSGQPAQV